MAFHHGCRRSHLDQLVLLVRHFQLLKAKECQIENLKVKPGAFLIFSWLLRPLENRGTFDKR